MYMFHSNTLWASYYIVVKKVVLRHSISTPSPKFLSLLYRSPVVLKYLIFNSHPFFIFLAHQVLILF